MRTLRNTGNVQPSPSIRFCRESITQSMRLTTWVRAASSFAIRACASASSAVSLSRSEFERPHARLQRIRSRRGWRPRSRFRRYCRFSRRCRSSRRCRFLGRRTLGPALIALAHATFQSVHVFTQPSRQDNDLRDLMCPLAEPSIDTGRHPWTTARMDAALTGRPALNLMAPLCAAASPFCNMDDVRRGGRVHFGTWSPHLLGYPLAPQETTTWQ